MILKFQSDSRISQYCLGRLIFGVRSNQNMGRNIRSRRTQRRPGEHKTPTKATPQSVFSFCFAWTLVHLFPPFLYLFFSFQSS